VVKSDASAGAFTRLERAAALRVTHAHISESSNPSRLIRVVTSESSHPSHPSHSSNCRRTARTSGSAEGPPASPLPVAAPGLARARRCRGSVPRARCQGPGGPGAREGRGPVESRDLRRMISQAGPGRRLRTSGPASAPDPSRNVGLGKPGSRQCSTVTFYQPVRIGGPGQARVRSPLGGGPYPVLLAVRGSPQCRPIGRSSPIRVQRFT
jgi:hypothetical protein